MQLLKGEGGRLPSLSLFNDRFHPILTIKLVCTISPWLTSLMPNGFLTSLAPNILAEIQSALCMNKMDFRGGGYALSFYVWSINSFAVKQGLTSIVLIGFCTRIEKDFHTWQFIQVALVWLASVASVV